MKILILLTSFFFIQSFNSTAPSKKSTDVKGAENPLYQFVPSFIITL